MPWRWFRHVVMRPDVSRYDQLVGGASPLEGESREFDPRSTHERGFWFLEVVIRSAGIPPSHAGGRELESQHAPARNSKGLGLHPRPFSFWLCHGHRLLAKQTAGASGLHSSIINPVVDSKESMVEDACLERGPAIGEEYPNHSLTGLRSLL